MDDDRRNPERIRLPPILPEQYGNSSSSGQEHTSQGSFGQAAIPSISALTQDRNLFQHQYPAYPGYLDITRRPIYSQQYNAPKQPQGYQKSGPTSLSSPNPGENMVTSDPNMDPKVLERRRRNATASAKSRTRRRNREIEMQQRNQFLERQLLDLTQTINNMGNELNSLKESNSGLKSHADSLERSRQQDRDELNHLREELVRLNLNKASHNEVERVRESYQRRFEAEDRYKNLYESYTYLNTTVKDYEERIKELEKRLEERRDKFDPIYTNLHPNAQEPQYKLQPFQAPEQSYNQPRDQYSSNTQPNTQSRYSL
ncbi:hypothetical protein K502DRAFT_366079 [Neoconidiobolus thromboides FSU 785]|nr:hypothetical protein K502DRAFT_366079 [Neoconidiobolus thromboides FSU 785]